MIKEIALLPAMWRLPTPSVLSKNAAKSQVAMNSKNTIFDVKRLISRQFDEKIQSDVKHWPFEVVNDCRKPKIQMEYKGETRRFTPEEISSMVLTKMKETAVFLGYHSAGCSYHCASILQ